MTNIEFSNEFDILYNSIASNQAPALDEYEKSVFLTISQDDVIKSYFSPIKNKTREGFDASERRQIDFSMIMRSVRYRTLKFTINNDESNNLQPPIKDIEELDKIVSNQNGSISESQFNAIDKSYINITKGHSAPDDPPYFVASPFFESFFDYRDNTKSIILNRDVLMFTNEYVVVDRASEVEGEPISYKTRLTVVPISYVDYSRLMSKAFKRPVKGQAWRLLDNNGITTPTSLSVKKAEIIVGPNDNLVEYVARYVKRPRAIRLTTFDDVEIDGGKEEQTCELDPILHHEILQRAVELAKAAYTGDLSSQIALGQTSKTDIGIIQTQ